MLVGEAPGGTEDRTGRPFDGKSGKELNGLYLPKCAEVSRERVFVSNVVKCRPGDKDETPSPELADFCGSHYLDEEIERIHPTHIAAVGATATRYLLGWDTVNMERVHGLVFYSPRFHTYVMPVYHPSFGLHNTPMMRFIMDDFRAFGGFVRGRGQAWVADTEEGDYSTRWDDGEIGSTIAVDTETEGNRLWSIQVSPKPYRAWLVKGEDSGGIARLREGIKRTNPVVVLHNAPFDLKMLHSVGIFPERYTDTMQMAYLLGMNGKGLKTLAFRIAWLVMREYGEVVAPAGEEKLLQYLVEVSQREWPEPEPEYEIKGGELKMHYPQRLEKRLKKYLKQYVCGDTKGSLVDYWKDKQRSGDRRMVEKVLGPTPVGYLSDIPFEEALRYACMDADATMRVYPHLMADIESYGLGDTLERDMAIVPDVVEIMTNGMIVNPDRLREIDRELDKGIMETLTQLRDMAGRWVNPNSTQQIAQFLYEKGVFESPLTSTDAEVMDRFNDREEVKVIQKHRELVKLKGTYVLPLLKYRDKNSRVHSDMSMSATETGRLASSNVNLQNVPTRTEQGRKIRDAFVSELGVSSGS
uniref:Putative DNA polymerase n=1 Tax=viral metagenome TaxID=1070528 RepID=A0A6M3IJL4_9ZZZZ